MHGKYLIKLLGIKVWGYLLHAHKKLCQQDLGGEKRINQMQEESSASFTKTAAAARRNQSNSFKMQNPTHFYQSTVSFLLNFNPRYFAMLPTTTSLPILIFWESAPGALLSTGNLPLHNLKRVFKFLWCSMKRFFLNFPDWKTNQIE